MTAPVLKPLSLGEALDVAFGLYRALFVPLLVVTLVTRAVPLVLSIYVEAAGGLLANSTLYALTVLTSVILGAVAAAASTFIVSESYLGRALSAGAAFARATPFIGRLILLALLTGLLLAFGFVLLIIPGLILLPGLILATPALVLEGNLSATDALGRSWSLTRGHRLRVFAAMVVVGILLFLPFIALGTFMGVAAPVEGGGEAGALAGGLAATMIAAVIQTLIYPFFYCVLVVLYYDLRVRKEAYDLEVLAANLTRA